jgi:hypothetical protein
VTCDSSFYDIVSFSEAQAHRKLYEKWVTAAPVQKQKCELLKAQAFVKV